MVRDFPKFHNLNLLSFPVVTANHSPSSNVVSG